MELADNTVTLSQDPRYKETISRLIDHLKDIINDIEIGNSYDARSKLDSAIEALEGQKEI